MTESEEANQSKTSLGLKYPEHAVVEVSDKNSSLGSKILSAPSLKYPTKFEVSD